MHSNKIHSFFFVLCARRPRGESDPKPGCLNALVHACLPLACLAVCLAVWLPCCLSADAAATGWLMAVDCNCCE